MHIFAVVQVCGPSCPWLMVHAPAWSPRTNLLILFVRNLVRKNMFSKQVLHCDCLHSGAGSTSRARTLAAIPKCQTNIWTAKKRTEQKNGCLRFVLFLINTVITNVFLITIDLCLPRARLSGHKVLSISFSFNVSGFNHAQQPLDENDFYFFS